MELAPICEKANTLFQKYKFVVLIVLIGIAFMLIPAKSEINTTAPEPTQFLPAVSDLENQLEATLTQVEGAGRVEVMLTTATGEQTVYQTNDNISAKESDSNVSHQTVTVTDAQRSQNGLIKQINPPTYLGAIVVCQGADSAAVRLAITEAVSKITGLGADRISVLKMK